MKKDKKEDLRFVCPSCKKEYKHLGWYKRHCMLKHSAILSYITKKVVDKRDIERIFTKIDSLEVKIDTLLNGGIHNIDIKRIKKSKDIDINSQEYIGMSQCVQELKGIFSEGLNLISRMEDIEVGIKSETEIIEVIKRNHKEVIVQ